MLGTGALSDAGPSRCARSIGGAASSLRNVPWPGEQLEEPNCPVAPE